MLLREHLPPKMEIVIFCGMTELQENLYKHFVLSKTLRGFINGTLDSNNALACILSLKKLLTHPNMIYPQKDEESEEEEDNTQLFETFGLNLKSYCLLKEIQETGDRVVIVSNFKCILNEVEKLCKHREYTWSRLDGSTSSDKRMPIVNAFNSPKSKDFIFLLSSKAGGCGLNLIGANRLIMLDPDWNPSNDEQAMARVWRDGQKKNVFIYRLIGCGTIEEKIFQRQIVKTGLSKSTLDEKSTKAQFSSSMLKELFKYDSDSNCTTYKPEENDIGVAKEKDPVLSVVLDNENINIPFIKITLDTEEKP
ncbi:hypothetical protein C9374_004318 [Naegleria lovaniensis]|uniref:Helicase C-terminal domain-containing protein n=1 Tax=Naegleria lovaniensis TaxID=51637 RepID=A0AA88GSP5_NAELO|nr:uncharacterized protein C9374_004318 [Naegleria lovaniensis]KAG2383647.1 hypothetical protein C9374_004318 [Naegleria lovaniensis]